MKSKVFQIQSPSSGELTCRRSTSLTTVWLNCLHTSSSWRWSTSSLLLSQLRGTICANMSSKHKKMGTFCRLQILSVIYEASSRWCCFTVLNRGLRVDACPLVLLLEAFQDGHSQSTFTFCSCLFIFATHRCFKKTFLRWKWCLDWTWAGPLGPKWQFLPIRQWNSLL